MNWGRCLRLYAPGIVVIVLALLVPFTGNPLWLVVARGWLLGVSLLVSIREQLRTRRKRRNGQRDGGRKGGRRVSD